MVNGDVQPDVSPLKLFVPICQIPWLVKTDDDMIPDIWTMEKIVNEMKGNNSR